MNKRFLTVVLGLTLVCLSTMQERVAAYDGRAHEWIALNLDQIFTFPEFSELYKSTLVYGSSDADHDDHVYDIDGFCITCTHFWDADDSNELVETSVTVFDINCPNAWNHARTMLNWAHAEYVSGNKEFGYEYLGHVVHFISDMCAPAHVHMDSHIDDEPYEQWIEEGNYEAWTGATANANGGLVTIPEAARQQIIGLPANDGGPLDPPGLGADLYYLMYTANQITDYFASEEGEGDTDDRRGWVDFSNPPPGPTSSMELHDNSWDCYCICPACPCPPMPMQCVDDDNDDDGQLTQIANVSYVYAMRASATMLKSFRDSIDSVPPETTIELEGVEGHDGWFRDDVLMEFSAEDFGDHPSGVYKTYWKFQGGADWYSFTDNGPHLITAEGSTDVEYRSMDWLGNDEAAKQATIKIDKTDPVITITSPDANGFYLTSGTLTIDFAVSDALSGVYSSSAKLDGQEVTDEQVFDLADMGGFHTFTVEVEDYAGNMCFQDVVFSIKIHATVDLKPDVFNLKSASDPVPVYVEFPTGYDVGQIDVSTGRLIPKMGWFLTAKDSPTAVGDYDKDEVPDRMLQFSRQDMITTLNGETGIVTITVIGELDGGTEFYGTEPVLVTHPPKK